MSERMEHIRQNLAEFDSLAERFVYESYLHDVSYLLERIDQLERENKKLKRHAEGWGRSADAYMEENKRLRASIWEFLREAYPDGTDHPADQDAANLERSAKVPGAGKE